MARIDILYLERCATPHNIDRHLPLLRRLASECSSVTEFGTDIGFSTTAFIASRCQEVRCYDLKRSHWVDKLLEMAEEVGVSMEFHQADTLSFYPIPETDLLLIDSEHTYEQVSGELKRHAWAVRKYLAFHDTMAFPCIVPAIKEYMAGHPEWEEHVWSTVQSGMAIYRRVR